MSRVFNQTMDDIAKLSGCDWDFVVAMYNRLWETHGDVDIGRFAAGTIIYDWGARGNGRFEQVLVDLCEKSGYTYTELFNILVDMIYDLDDDGDWQYFVGVTMEHDW